MKKAIFAGALLLALALTACTTTTPEPEFVVVTATMLPPTLPPPTPVPTATPDVPPSPTPPEDGNPAEFVAIISPGNGTAWESTDWVEVTGSARGMPNDDVVVFFVDEGRNIHGYACAQLGQANANNIKAYSTRMTAPVNVDTDGRIIAAVLADEGGAAGSGGDVQPDPG